MRTRNILTIVLVLCVSMVLGQNIDKLKPTEIISLKSVAASPGMGWKGGERITNSDFDKMPIVSNVSVPSLMVFLPDPAKANGTSLIIAPGGGFHMLSIDNEGNDLAYWCVEHGIAAFVLKYRLVPTGENPGKEFADKLQKGQRQMDSVMAPYIKLANADGLAAIAYVREQAARFKVSPDKIGIIGFSAGGTVAAYAGLEYTNENNRPNFFAPVYGALHVLNLTKLPAKPMPLFLVVSSDDYFGFQTLSMELYKNWNAAKLPAELHIYEKGGHGFGMKKQGLPSDEWINAFASWLSLHGFLRK